MTHKRPFSKPERGSGMAEAALTLPVVLLVAFMMINLAMAGYASVAASNAANYGARVGSVAQSGAAGRAASATPASVNQAGVGTYTVSAGGGGRPGAQIVVNVTWSVPNYFASMAAFFGHSFDSEIKGSTRSTFRQEGW
jgi:Flp pilus assembly protein TadG